MKSTISTHLVSKVILKQFTNKEGELNVTNKANGTTRPAKTGEVAFVEIDRTIIEALEKQWTAEVETHATKTLNVLGNGDILLLDKHVTMLKKIMSLHFVRSTVLIVILTQTSETYGQQIIDEMTTAYPEHKALIAEQVKQDWPRLTIETLPIILSENIDKVEDFMAKHGLEIGLAPEGSSFIIGDSPAITMGDNGRMGVLNGVAITDSKSFAMPVTPKHLVTLKTDPKTTKYIELTAKQVENANGKQVQHALFEYYSKPD